MKAEIEYIINKKITDDKKIQLTLDYLFDLLDDEEALLQYRKLCKYYYNINPQATIHYINYYREHYDPDGLNFEI